MTVPGLPTVMTHAPLRTFRPQDLAAVYTQPGVQLNRLTRQGRVRRAAHGYYYAVPDDQDPTWTPGLEALAAGIATAVFGERVPVLMHLSAARMHGALPRAIGVVLVATPRQHAPVLVDLGRPATVTFVARDVDRLDAVLVGTDLGPALATTVEQTVLDVARRPDLGGMPDEALAVVRALLPRCDGTHLADLARDQRMTRVLDRVVQTLPAAHGG